MNANERSGRSLADEADVVEIPRPDEAADGIVIGAALRPLLKNCKALVSARGVDPQRHVFPLDPVELRIGDPRDDFGEFSGVGLASVFVVQLRRAARRAC